MINVTDRTIRRTMELLRIHRSYIHFDKPNGEPLNDEANLRQEAFYRGMRIMAETILGNDFADHKVICWDEHFNHWLEDAKY